MRWGAMESINLVPIASKLSPSPCLSLHRFLLCARMHGAMVHPMLRLLPPQAVGGPFTESEAFL